MRRLLFASLWLAACAQGGSTGPRHGDAGPGGGSPDAPTDSGAGGEEDAAAPDEDSGVVVEIDAGRDAGPPPTPDAGRSPDSGCASGSMVPCVSSCGTSGRATCTGGGLGMCVPPVESCNGSDDDCDSLADDGFECRQGSSSTCTASCGTIGMRTCGATCAWTACTPPAETCNGLDEDCDSVVDDGFACARSTSGSCTTTCGSSGTRTCSASCTWSACSAPAESCNGSDDDCDGLTDEGFRVAVVRASYATDLAAHHPPCNGTTQIMGPDCNAAIHRWCASRGCTNSGFGPDEHGGGGADVTCLSANVRNTTYTELSTHHGGCDGVAQRIGTDCNAAIHRYCASIGMTSGFGPVENSGDFADVTCVPYSVVVVTGYSTLVTHHSGCNATTRIGPDCNAAIHRFCRAMGHESGWGPVENTGDTAVVTCVPR
jgi:hypothetical protein